MSAILESSRGLSAVEFVRLMTIWRKGQKMTQVQAAMKLGVNRSTVERWEAGIRSPDKMTVRALQSIVSPVVIGHFQ